MSDRLWSRHVHGVAAFDLEGRCTATRRSSGSECNYTWRIISLSFQFSECQIRTTIEFELFLWWGGVGVGDELLEPGVGAKAFQIVVGQQAIGISVPAMDGFL